MSLAALRHSPESPERLDGPLLGRFATFMMGGLASEALLFSDPPCPPLGMGLGAAVTGPPGDLDILRKRMLSYRPNWFAQNNGTDPSQRILAFERRAFRRACILLAQHDACLQGLIEAMASEAGTSECIEILERSLELKSGQNVTP